VKDHNQHSDGGAVVDDQPSEKVLEILLRPDLLAYIMGVIATVKGLIGERVNTLLIFLAGMSSRTGRPQYVDVSGPSSEGKSKTAESALEPFGGDAEFLGAVSKTSFTHQFTTQKEGDYNVVDLEGRIIVLLEKDNSREVLNYLKPTLAQDAHDIKVQVTESKTKGHQTKQVILRGCPAMITISTGTTKDEEQGSRSWTVTPTMGPMKYRRVNMAKAKRAAFPFVQESTNNDMDIVKAAVKAMTPIKVINPFATLLATLYPSTSARSMRDFDKVLSLMECSTLIHQYQRLQVDVRGERYAVASIDDLHIALAIIDVVLEGTVTGIPRHVLDFFTRVVVDMDENNADLTYKSMALGYQERYGSPIKVNTLKKKFVHPLLDNNLLEITNHPNKPYLFAVIRNDTGAWSTLKKHSNPCESEEFKGAAEELVNIVTSIRNVYGMGNEIEIEDEARAWSLVDRYIRTGMISQCFIDEISSERIYTVDTGIPDDGGAGDDVEPAGAGVTTLNGAFEPQGVS